MFITSPGFRLIGAIGLNGLDGPSFQAAEPVMRLLLVRSASKRPKYFRFGLSPGAR